MAMPHFLLKSAALLAAAAFLAGCSASGENLGDTRPELGDFQLCYNIVTTNDAVKGPLSRDADLEVFADLIRDEIDRRFGRYEGGRLYHIALHLDAYVLAMPGVPLVAQPRSALIVSANVWDDQLGRPLNAEPEQITALESAGANSIVGSGLTMNETEQMAMLAQNVGLSIEEWMVQHPEWFDHAEPENSGTFTTPDDELGLTPPAETPAEPAVAPENPANLPEGPTCGRR